MSTPTHEPQTLADHLTAEAERDEQELLEIRDHVETVIDDTLTDAVTGETQPRLEQWREQMHDTTFQRYTDATRDELITELQERDASWAKSPEHFATQETWNEHGRHVTPDANGFEIRTEDGTRTVFAYEQTTPDDHADPEDVFETVATQHTTDRDAREFYDTLKTAAETGAFGVVGRSIYVEEVGLETLGFMVDGVSQGRVYVKDKHNTGEMFRVLSHEIAHELLHKGRDQGRSARVEEVEADVVACAVVEYFGFTTTKLELYIAQWVRREDAVGDDMVPADLIGADRVDVVTDTAAAIVKAVRDN